MTDRSRPDGGRDDHLPEGVVPRTIDGDQRLTTRGAPVYGEPTAGEWRAWDPGRSKLGALLGRGVETGFEGGDTVLYLGAASGTTVSHVADFSGPTYAVEFAPRPARDLVRVAEERPNLFPLLKDARRPETYAHVVESDVDVLFQDVATRGQGDVACRNRRFLADDGWLVATVKARSEDVTGPPEVTYEHVVETIEEEYEVVTTERMDPLHEDHLAVVARPR
ncbi:fibrillarin-like rRNA/tRNA 2'-O-methyltransferase [Haloarchaeobius sp. HRN-SO-5]|uniref:fibrillarin-like rRNA/tRNA 2'-O-methyltransferase n=1 Tax=Haloarchaeobius sp. HRN-SO-5 TaxID=3446118 RepID=UPI003EBD6DFF